MNRYRVPEFKIQELISALYGLQVHQTSSGVYSQCPVTVHRTPGRYGTFRMYPDNGRHGTCVCPCGIKGTVWDFLTEYEHLPPYGSDSFDETILFVCDALGIEPQLATEAEPSISEKVRDLYIGIAKSLKPLHFPGEDPSWKKGKWRGISPLTWLSYDVGILLKEDLNVLLSKHGEQTFLNAGLSSWKNGTGFNWLTHGPLILFRNATTTPVGLAVRRYDCFAGYTGDVKYVKNSSNPWMKPSDYIFGARLASSREAIKDTAIYIVEGEIDCLKMQMQGILSTVAIGSGLPSDTKVQTLLKEHRRLVFICDTDANYSGWKHAVEISQRIGNCSFVFLPSDETGSMDPDVYFTKHTVEDFRRLPIMSGREVRMRDAVSKGKSEGLISVFMKEIIRYPTETDPQDLKALAELTGTDLDHLKSWLFTSRITEHADKLKNLEVRMS